VEVFAGNTADPTSFISAAQAVRERFGLDDVVMVGDRGMITSARIEALKAVGGLGWLTSLRAPQVAALVSSGMLQMSLFDEVNLAEISHPGYPGERLVACRGPALAKERTRKREELLAATEALLGEVKAAVERDKRPYRGKDKIALRLGKLITATRWASTSS
jgi:transposase